ncbi:MAG: LysR family transcriptional regulator [Acidaminococcaceae bacterium]|nr:LysR family transcriptional regulator [Acidaminococcaceae bacterium]MDD4721347.1 LysR family transcriptional regulator [Acidaminococcaceae bacterium]
MNFTQISYFLAILRTGTFTGAADDSFISQSSMSKQIKALEDELGVKLFKREHSKVYLSEAGYEFFAFAEKAASDRLDLEASMKRFSSKHQGTIIIGSIPVVTAYGISGMFAKFQVEMLKKGANINFDLYSEEQNTVFHALKNNRIDLAFLRPPYLSKDLYESITVAVDDFVFICHKDNPLSKALSLDIKCLKNERIILLTPRSTLYQVCIAELGRNGLKDNVVATTGRHAVILEMVSNKLGVTLLPRKLLNNAAFPNLRTVELTSPIKTELVLTKQKDKTFNPTTMKFWEFVKKNYEINKT